MVPFPWGRSSKSSRTNQPESGRDVHLRDEPDARSRSPESRATRPSHGSKSPMAYKSIIPFFGEVLDECNALGCISFQLPPPKSLAGAALDHAISTINKLFSKHSPMIWKIGFTRNPVWRWRSKIYGYKWSQDRWSDMVIVYLAPEPFGPAMLEAALIDKFNCSLPQFGKMKALCFEIDQFFFGKNLTQPICFLVPSTTN